MEGQRPFNHNIIRSSFVKKHYKETILQGPILHKTSSAHNLQSYTDHGSNNIDLTLHGTLHGRTTPIQSQHYKVILRQETLQGNKSSGSDTSQTSSAHNLQSYTDQGSSNIDLTLQGTLYGTLHGRTKPIQSKHYKVILGEETLQGNKSSGFNTSQRVK